MAKIASPDLSEGMHSSKIFYEIVLHLKINASHHIYLPSRFSNVTSKVTYLNRISCKKIINTEYIDVQ